MLFNSILSAIDCGSVVDAFTIVDSNVDDCDEIGQMLLLHSDGRVESGMDQCIINKIQEVKRQEEWIKPTTIWVQNHRGDRYRIFWDRLVRNKSAVVFGGGHISQPLVQILSLLDFNVTVVDDRPSFANHSRFPEAAQVICDSFQTVLGKLIIDCDTAVIIVTRGHKYDIECLRVSIGSSARYLGMIGSRKRVKEIIHLLREEGIAEHYTSRIRAPIGLDIKADTPAEIAVSISAEVVSVFRGGSGKPLYCNQEV